MARNVEIKARWREPHQIQLAREVADQDECSFTQRDVFYDVAHGRLKLRVQSDQPAHLIAYRRPNQPGPKTSEYQLVQVHNPIEMEQLLGSTLDCMGVVTKTRILIRVGQTRLHFDRVDGLGSFIELEVVLAPDQESPTGQAIAKQLMNQLEIRPEDLIADAYVDLLAQT